MLSLSIPGFNNDLQLHHLLLDFNGTLAIDGKLIEGVKEALNILSGKITLHVLTADTFGSAEEELKDISCKIIMLPPGNQCFEKGRYTVLLDKETVISIGNGNNDRLMLQLSAIGIIVIQKEGASVETLMAADIVCTDILSVLNLLNNPLRLTATLRS